MSTNMNQAFQSRGKLVQQLSQHIHDAGTQIAQNSAKFNGNHPLITNIKGTLTAISQSNDQLGFAHDFQATDEYMSFLSGIVTYTGKDKKGLENSHERLKELARRDYLSNWGNLPGSDFPPNTLAATQAELKKNYASTLARNMKHFFGPEPEKVKDEVKKTLQKYAAGIYGNNSDPTLVLQMIEDVEQIPRHKKNGESNQAAEKLTRLRTGSETLGLVGTKDWKLPTWAEFDETVSPISLGQDSAHRQPPAQPSTMTQGGSTDQSTPFGMKNTQSSNTPATFPVFGAGQPGAFGTDNAQSGNAFAPFPGFGAGQSGPFGMQNAQNSNTSTSFSGFGAGQPGVFGTDNAQSGTAFAPFPGFGAEQSSSLGGNSGQQPGTSSSINFTGPKSPAPIGSNNEPPKYVNTSILSDEAPSYIRTNITVPAPGNYGKFVHMRAAGRGAWRVVINRGTESKPYYEYVNGSLLPADMIDANKNKPGMQGPGTRASLQMGQAPRVVDVMELPMANNKKLVLFAIDEQGALKFATKSEMIRCYKKAMTEKIMQNVSWLMKGAPVPNRVQTESDFGAIFSQHQWQTNETSFNFKQEDIDEEEEI